MCEDRDFGEVTSLVAVAVLFGGRTVERCAADLALLLCRAARDADLDATVSGAATTGTAATDGRSEVGTLVQIAEHVYCDSPCAPDEINSCCGSGRKARFGGRNIRKDGVAVRFETYRPSGSCASDPGIW